MEDSEQLIASKHNKPAEASVRVYSCKEKEPVYQQRVAKEEGLEAVHVPIPSTCFCIYIYIYNYTDICIIFPGILPIGFCGTRSSGIS